MKKVVQRLKLSVVGAALAATAVSLGGVIAVSNAVAATQLTANGWVNLRTGPGTSYDVIDTVPKGGVVTATGVKTGSWTQVVYEGKTGFVYSAYWTEVPEASTTTGTPSYALTTAELNVRTGPGTSFEVVGLTTLGQSMSLTGVTAGAWVQVNWQGAQRWVSSYYLTTSAPAETTMPVDDTVQPVAVVGQVRVIDDMNLRTEGYFGAPTVGILPADSIVDITGNTTASYTQVLYQGRLLWIASSYTRPLEVAPALSLVTDTRARTLVDYVRAQVGEPYIWGAEGPYGFDCSGLTWSAYQQIGITIPRTSATQWTVGTWVAKADLQPGDLIFWDSPVSHVSMYVGDGMMVHARNTTVGVVEQSVDSYIAMGGKYTGAKRFLN